MTSDDDEKTVANGRRLPDPAPRGGQAERRDDRTRVDAPSNSRPPKVKAYEPPPTATEPSMPAIRVPMPTVTEPSMQAVSVPMPPVTQPAMPAVGTPAVGTPARRSPTQSQMVALGAEEPLPSQKLNRRTQEFAIAHRVHPLSIVVVVVIVLLVGLLAIDWLTEPNPDGSPSDTPGQRIHKLITW